MANLSSSTSSNDAIFSQISSRRDEAAGASLELGNSYEDYLYTTSKNSSSETELLYEYETQLVDKSYLLFLLYTYAEIPLISIGTTGHCLGLFVLFGSLNMRTTSFLYLKALTIAELLYCANCIVHKLIEFFFAVRNMEQCYSNFAAAFYSATISRIMSSATGYTILYMTLFVAVDRFSALYCPNKHRAMTIRRDIACRCIAGAVFVGTFVNSWTTALENYVEPRSVPTDSDQEPQGPIGTLSGPSTGPLYVTVYKMMSRNSPPLYLQLRNVKNVYNGVLRIAYPLTLAALTVAVICGFIAQRQRRRKLHRECTKQARRERNLFCMLIIIVVLVTIQVLPTETRRILEFVRPKSMLDASLRDPSVPLEQKLRNLEILVLGHLWIKLIANLCTFVNRSLSFYLYFVFNRTFRLEVLRLLKNCCTSRRRHGRQRMFEDSRVEAMEIGAMEPSVSQWLLKSIRLASTTV